jgi:hypothetical protein
VEEERARGTLGTSLWRSHYLVVRAIPLRLCGPRMTAGVMSALFSALLVLPLAVMSWRAVAREC